MRELGVDDVVTTLQLRSQAAVYAEKWEEAQLGFASALVMHVAQHDWAGGGRDLYLAAELFGRRQRANDAARAVGLSTELAARANAPHDQVLGWIAQANTFSQVGEIARADEAFQKASQIHGRTARERAWWSFKQGNHLVVKLDFAEAIRSYREALAIGEQEDFPDIRNPAHLNLARLEAEAGHIAVAKQHLGAYVRAENDGATYAMVAGLIARADGKLEDAERLLAEAATSPRLDEDYLWDIAYTRGCIAEAQGDVAMAERRFREAIEYVESVRSKMPELAIRPAVLAHRRAPYEALLALLAAHDRKRDALAVAELLHARAWADAAAALDRAHAPLVKEQSGSAVLAAVGDREALVFVRAKGVLWRFHLVRGDVAEVVALPELMNEISKWRSQPEDTALAAQLGAALLPARLTVATDRPLYVVAPELVGLPFAALRRGERYLIEERELMMLPGLAVASCRTVAAADDPPVIVADSRADLDSARDEASYVASLLGSVADIGAAATRSRVLRGRRARLLFIAAHAQLDEHGGSLLLQDGVLTAEDILKYGVAPKVAVLAGCATGDSQDPEGWGALSSSLLATGTRSVVATLRPVADKPTSTIMRAFFDARGDTRPSAALAAAQRANLAMRTRDWASFAVWGAASPDECP